MGHRKSAGESHRFFELPPWLWEAPHLAAKTFLVVREAIRRALFEDTLAMHAAAIAFYGLLSFGPVIMVMLAFGGMVLPGRADLVDALQKQMILIFPTAHEELVERITVFASQAKVYGLVGLVGLLWSGSRVFASLETCLNDIW